MEALSRRGHSVTVIDYPARSAPGNLRKSIRSRVFQGIYRTDPQSSVRLIRPPLINVSGIARLSSVLSNFKAIFEQTLRWCDIVVLYSVPTNGLQAILSSRLASKPLVFHAFDVLHGMTGHDFLKFPTWALERVVYRQVDRVVVISSPLAHYMKTIGVPEEDILLLPPAIDTKRFSPEVSGRQFRESIGVSDRDLVILFSGWLYEFSGVDVLMSAIPTLLTEIPQSKLVICGDGPLLTKLRSERIRLGLERSVIILGRRPYFDMPGIVAAADVCINPYLSETRSDFAFPSKIAEYMAAGKPVISSDLPGTRSMLGDSSGVVLVRPNHVALALKELLVCDHKRRELSRLARKYCEDNFSLDAITDKFESVLEQLVGATDPNQISTARLITNPSLVHRKGFYL